MRGTGIEKEVEICATNLTNRTKCMSTHAKKWKKLCEDMSWHKALVVIDKYSQHLASPNILVKNIRQNVRRIFRVAERWEANKDN
jgi:hypothetical protein